MALTILGLLVQAPDTTEQVHQGGAVGYVILGVGLLALLIAIERFISLMLMEAKFVVNLKMLCRVMTTHLVV